MKDAGRERSRHRFLIYDEERVEYPLVVAEEPKLLDHGELVVELRPDTQVLVQVDYEGGMRLAHDDLVERATTLVDLNEQLEALEDLWTHRRFGHTQRHFLHLGARQKSSDKAAIKYYT